VKRLEAILESRGHRLVLEVWGRERIALSLRTPMNGTRKPRERQPRPRPAELFPVYRQTLAARGAGGRA
jgi:hypothetical protein